MAKDPDAKAAKAKAKEEEKAVKDLAKDLKAIEAAQQRDDAYEEAKRKQQGGT